MKLIKDSNDSQYQIRSYRPGFIQVNEATYEQSLVICGPHLLTNWRPQALADLRASDWASVLELKPELILLGAGQNFKMPNHSLLEPIYKSKIGIETMTTAAACRTYIALSAEGRKVAAALIII